tara:strand:- start:373 stop:573 length:201 start_codon:yes stop_codon:yes gene_type:complete
MSYVKVEGHDNLVRNENGVILNTNDDEVKAARARKKARIKKDREFEDLKQEVSDLKGMMKQILEKL